LKILSVSPPERGGRELARASIEIVDGVRLHDVKVTRAGCVFARNVTLSPEAVKQISDLVISTMGRSPDADRSLNRR
jgi:hypothetical protein